MAAQDLTSLANVKVWLGIAGTNDDALLTRLITAISTSIENYCSQNLVSQTYTNETYTGNGGTKLLLQQGPISAVASLTIDGIAIPARPAVTQVGYYFSTDFLYVDGYSFTRPGTPASPFSFAMGSAQNVVVTYTAGYSPIPLDLEQACIDLVAFRFRERGRIGLKSETLAGQVTSYNISAFPDSVKFLLDQQYNRAVPQL